MAIIVDQLSVWEIGFRWSCYDPDKFCIRLPLLVRDNFRTLIHEIHHGHLDCFSLLMEKYDGNDPDEAKFHIRHWLDAVEACSDGRKYDKALLKWAIIDRQSFQEWCERHKVPLPEFWFPIGWGIEYEWPDDTTEVEIDHKPDESIKEKEFRIDKRHRIKMACQQIALSMWVKNSALSIKEIAMGNEVQELACGSEYEIETIQEWIGAVDPRDPSKKRGKKRKNNSGSGNPDQPQPPEK